MRISAFSPATSPTVVKFQPNEILDRMIDQLKMPVVLTLGNHDHRDRFKEVFGTLHDDENGHIQKAIDVRGYRVIVIDSSEPEIVSGVLCETRLSWLAARLEEAKDRPVIIVMHHHANDLHMPVDQIKLQESERFLDVLKDASRHSSGDCRPCAPADDGPVARHPADHDFGQPL